MIGFTNHVIDITTFSPNFDRFNSSVCCIAPVFSCHNSRVESSASRYKQPHLISLNISITGLGFKFGFWLHLFFLGSLCYCWRTISDLSMVWDRSDKICGVGDECRI